MDHVLQERIPIHIRFAAILTAATLRDTRQVKCTRRKWRTASTLSKGWLLCIIITSSSLGGSASARINIHWAEIHGMCSYCTNDARPRVRSGLAGWTTFCS